MQVSADVHASNKDWEEAEKEQVTPIVKAKLRRDQLKEHYEIYEACKHV